MIRLTRWQLLRSLLAVLLIVISWAGIAAAQTGLTIRFFERETVPLLYIAPKQAQAAPGVLVAHGFSGSKQLMLGYGYVLARAGYAVMLWDFDGHGANPNPLGRFDGNALQKNLQVALRSLTEQPGVDASRLALLGHSMGGSAVLSAGVNDVDRFAATIAVSSAGGGITPQAPRSLQLQVGAWEGRLIPYAERSLAQAGGANSQFNQGKARELIVVPSVEHITILFNGASHQAALKWLDAAFDRQSTSHYVDRRMIWYFLHLVGWLLALSVIAPKFAASTSTNSQITDSQIKVPIAKVPIAKVPIARSAIGLIGSAIAAVGGLLLLNPLVQLQSLGGVQVGGAVGVWFLIAGLVWLVVLGRFPRPSVRTVGLGLAVFALLWIAFGLMAQFVWLQWWLILPRLKVWLPIAIACFPWFLASGIVQQDISTRSRFLWWFGQSLILIGGFILVISVVPKLGFMFLLLPLFPVLIGLLSFVEALLNEAWIYAIASALLFAWLLAAGFPLSAA
ncbi:MAG: alpha/beta hydrolase [Myxacorys chilensis ATA2-1-KO14]|jgi:pimeloyl-ACP methyl ester carboxylesterase|nr:alpha/beta hydrolase [Myxacorys chilensis ATA2-1-KO14]